MSREKKNIGAYGEKIALSFLKRLGYRIYESNFRTPFGEIDIIAKHKKIMVFVEVKSRATSSLGPPYLSVTKMKEKSIIRNALFYLKGHKLLNADWRIDIVSVKFRFGGELESVELIENAVEDNYI
jgi:putative endonuclease